MARRGRRAPQGSTALTVSCARAVYIILPSFIKAVCACIISGQTLAAVRVCVRACAVTAHSILPLLTAHCIWYLLSTGIGIAAISQLNETTIQVNYTDSSRPPTRLLLPGGLQGAAGADGTQGQAGPAGQPGVNGTDGEPHACSRQC